MFCEQITLDRRGALGQDVPMTNTEQYPAGTRVIVSIAGMSLVGTVVADRGARVMSNRGPQIQVHFDGRTSPVPVNARQVIGPAI